MSYINSLKKQILSIDELLPVQLNNSFSESLNNVMTFSEMFDTRQIYLLGSGDSYAAALAVKPLLEKYCDCFGVIVMSPLEFARYKTQEQIGIGEPNSPLVIGISSSGSSSRLVEALRKANEIGAFTVAMTNNKDSVVAKEARRVYHLNTPPYEFATLGLRTYISSILGLIAFTARFGRVRGTLTPDTESIWRKEIESLYAKYKNKWDEIDEVVREYASENHKYNRFDFIGDDVQFATAYFGSATAVEAFGCISTTDDSENWCHINTFYSDSRTIPTVVVVNKNSNSYSRLLETIQQAKAIGRPVLVIGNIDENLIEGVTICSVPETEWKFDWLQPLFDCLPIALLSSYVAEFENEEYFRSETIMNQDTGKQELENELFELQTIAKSKIEYYK